MLAGALLAGPGCMRRYAIPVDELRKLDGFEDPALAPENAGRLGPDSKHPHRLLRSDDGTELRFNAFTDLQLQVPEGTAGGRFRQIRITPSHFEGVLVKPDRPLRLDLASIRYAQMEAVDHGATATSVALGSLLLVGGIVLAILFPRPVNVA